MQSKNIEMIAAFMIALIVSMPLYSTIALAALSSSYISEEASDVKGYYRKGETLRVSVDAELGGMEIDRSWLHIHDINGKEFDGCVEEGGLYKCYVTLGPGDYYYDTNFIKADRHEFKVGLYYREGDTLKSEMSDPIIGYFDTLPPEIKSFSISPSRISNGNVLFSYNLHDYSYEEVENNRCSGIRKVELYEGGELIKTDTINSDPGDCEFIRGEGKENKPLEVRISDFLSETEEGLISITLKAYDMLGRTSEDTATFMYDHTPPYVDPSWQLTGSAGNRIEYIKDELSADIIFRVEDQSGDLEADKVYVNISEINPANPSAKDYNEMKADCSENDEGGYSCTIENILVNPVFADGESSAVVKIYVNVSDTAGNSEVTDLSKTIYYDDVGPVAAISTDKESPTRSYAGKVTTFTAEITEAGAGIETNKILLDLNGIKSSPIQPDSCTKDPPSTWTCIWEDIEPDISAQDGPKTVSVSGEDLLGNVLECDPKEVILDTTPPKIVDFDASAVLGVTGPTGIGATFSDYIKTLDSMKVNIKVKEKNEIKEAKINFSTITTFDSDESKDPENRARIENTDMLDIEFRSSQINVPGHHLIKLPIRITDMANNTIPYLSEEVEIHNYTDENFPIYWDSKVRCSPELVDRQVTTLINFNVICSIKLTDTVGDSKTVSLSLDQNECTENIEGSMGYIKSENGIKLKNNAKGSTSPYLDIKLSQVKMDIDRISVSCPLEIITEFETEDGKKGITKNAEIENISIDLSLYNMPLGEFDKVVEQQIRDVEDKIAVGWEWIGKLKEALFYAEKVCDILKLLNRIAGIFGTSEIAFSKFPVIGPIISTIAVSTEQSSTAATASNFNLCKLISCDQTLWFKDYSGQRGLWGDTQLGKYKRYLAKYNLGTMFPDNPKDSLILSVATGCLPGIVYNIEKWRQIQCNYGVCLWDTSENNMPISVCDDQESYMVCKFVMGEVFHAILPLNWLRNIFDKIKTIFSNPFTFIFKLLEKALCTTTPPEAHGACSKFKAAMVMLEIAADVDKYFQSETWELQGDMCEVYFDRLEKLDQESQI
ncbi:hypothetical protein KY358_05275 [Candidatus Woesearchaeota archaeon]|nr:hypothetical protein [Candidatus Woesearchaeota archaeon]